MYVFLIHFSFSYLTIFLTKILFLLLYFIRYYTCILFKLDYILIISYYLQFLKLAK